MAWDQALVADLRQVLLDHGYSRLQHLVVRLLVDEHPTTQERMTASLVIDPVWKEQS